MKIKVIVLYPEPVDAAAFEAGYHGHHMPMMRRIVGDPASVPTHKVLGPQGERPFYRMAEILFPDRAALDAFAASEDARIARQSSEALSTGGKPIVFVCKADAAP
jgi:uncharacterized protein (TIGR02118 family)